MPRAPGLSPLPSDCAGDNPGGWTISRLRAGLHSGRITSSALVDFVLSRALDPDGEGRRVFITINEAQARAAAAGWDARSPARLTTSPLAGLPVSIKDNIDIDGQVTRAGSRVLEDRPAATRDAVVAQRLRAAGAVVLGRTNMSELAFSGLGCNLHYGTPLNAHDRSSGRIPGGSSSGAAVSIQERMAVAAIGTDTGGSLRIPAALCGLVGFRPTQARVPLDGVLPLSAALDTVGPIASTVDDVSILDGVLSGAARDPAYPRPSNIRFCMLGNYMMEGMDEGVSRVFERALRALSDGGCTVVQIHSNPLSAIAELHAHGTLPAAEAWEAFGDLLQRRRRDFDPRVADRIERGRSMTAADLIRLRRGRAALIQAIDPVVQEFDAFIGPTVPMVAPLLAALEDDTVFHRTNLLMLRNPTVANLLDRPSISVPCHLAGELPAGLMLTGHRGEDERLLAIARVVEELLPPAGKAISQCDR